MELLAPSARHSQAILGCVKDDGENFVSFRICPNKSPQRFLQREACVLVAGSVLFLFAQAENGKDFIRHYNLQAILYAAA